MADARDADLVEAEDRAGIRVLRLRRPPVNALNLSLAVALGNAAARATSDASCTGVVLTGADGVFSAGLDTREVPAYDTEQRAAMLRALNRLVLALYALPKPLVAAVSGHALGGALVIALTADARVAARGAFQIGLTEALAGIPFPAGPLAVVRAELSPDQQRKLALGSQGHAPDAPELAGVFDRVVAPDTLLADAVAEARRRATLPAFASVKQQLRADAVERLTRIVEDDDEPLLEGWM